MKRAIDGEQMMTEKFSARYQVQDGYSGGARPRHFNISAADLDDEMSDEQLVEFYEECVQTHYEETVSPGAERVDEFVAWAREQLKSRDA